MPARRAASRSMVSTPTPQRTIPAQSSLSSTDASKRGTAPARITAAPAACSTMASPEAPSPTRIEIPAGPSTASSTDRST